MNSWQQPTSGEPSFGTLHPHEENILSSASPTATTQIFNFTSTQIPLGTAKAVHVRAICTPVSGGQVVSVRNSVTDQPWVVARGQVAAVNIEQSGPVPVTSTGGFKIVCSTTTVTREIELLGWYG